MASNMMGAVPPPYRPIALPQLADLTPLENQKNWSAVVARCDYFLAQRPVELAGQDFQWLDHLALAHFNLENHEAALATVEKLLVLRPRDFGKQFYRATALKNLGRFAAATESLEWLASCADYPRNMLCQLFTSLALNYHILGDYENSLAAVKLAREFFKQYGGDEADLKKREAFCYLHHGDYAKGFEHYEYRHDAVDAQYFNAMPHHRPEKIWHGEAMQDKTLLITMEQGLGDMVMMARFLPLIAKRAKKIIVECYQELHRLLLNSPLIAGVANIEIVLFTNQPRLFDAWTKVMSLPYHLGINQDNVPNILPYLQPPPGEVALPASDKKYKIGLVWQSGVKGLDKANRSMNVADMAAIIAVENCQFFSFQYDSDSNKIKNEIAATGFADKIIDTAPMIKDLADTAMLMEKMDVIITVDTVAAHLAGALNRPVWVILPFETSWKWHRHVKANWYPNCMTLFRQTTAAQWQTPVLRVASCLQQIVAQKNATADDFIHVEKTLPRVATTPQFSPPDMLTQSKNTMNAKNYWPAAIYMKKALADKTITPAMRKLMLLNARNAWRAVYEFDRAISTNEQLLRLHEKTPDQTPAELVEAELSQCQLLQNTWRVAPAMKHLANAQKILDGDAALKKQQDIQWQKQAMFGYLRQGDYKKAWQYYEYRHGGIVQYDALKYLPHHIPEKKLQKQEDIKNKTILVAMEQGYGDIIQFARFVPQLARRCQAVVVESYEPLYPLFKQVLEKDNVKVILWERETPSFDHWLLICSLPYFLDSDEKTLRTASANPYFQLPAAFKKTIPQKRKKIGINWFSSLIGKDHETKSMKLEHLLPLFKMPDVDFFSLQRDGTDKIRSLGLQGLLVDLSPMINNFLDTAAWLSAMDMVITIDTAPAHLAGALGLNTKLLLHKNCDWRWGSAGNKCWWYENNMTIYRQPTDNDWAGAVELLMQDITSSKN
ncbi:MAG: hypothetical protein QM529_07055 [Hydrotalea sp.]|nr:hypothetical protein [Hydrotalea sp.]